MRLCIHWRRRHVSEERIAAVKAALLDHPGGDRVSIAVTGTGKNLLLPPEFSVDAEASGIVRAVHRATNCTGMAHVVGYEDAF